MSPPRDKDPHPPAASPATPPKPKPEPKPAAGAGSSGRVTYDSRGNAQWDLGMSTTEIRKLSRTGMLRKLDSSGLSIADDPPASDAAKSGAAKGGATTPAADPAKPSRVEGFNPYDRPLLPKKPRR